MDDVREAIANDPYCARLSISLETLDTGHAVTALELDESLCNFHGTPHGGAVYSLADAAFAAASNAHGEAALALETNISYLAPATVGETITAVAEETHAAGRTAEYDVQVSDASDDPIATFRGRVYRPD
jgi:acyl-CoA thioesterase